MIEAWCITCLNQQILIFNFSQPPACFNNKLIWEYFWPKSNFRPVLGSHRSPLGPQKSQIKLTIASFLSPNQMEHTVFPDNISKSGKRAIWKIKEWPDGIYRLEVSIFQEFSTNPLNVSVSSHNSVDSSETLESNQRVL